VHRLAARHPAGEALGHVIEPRYHCAGQPGHSRILVGIAECPGLSE
jgi:hypothetical protein